MIERLLPPEVAVMELHDFAGCPRRADERHLVERATRERQQEFAAGRACARGALARLGVLPQPILAGPWGEPLWPPQFLGSITHCRNYAACAVGRSELYLGIGIDAECNLPLKAGILSSIANSHERASVAEFSRRGDGVNWDRLLFSAKEASFKAWFPRRREPMRFHDFLIALDPSEGRFSAACRDWAGVRAWRAEGRWLLVDDLIITVVTMPA